MTAITFDMKSEADRRACHNGLRMLSGQPEVTDSEWEAMKARSASTWRAIEAMRAKADAPDVKRVVHPPFDYDAYIASLKGGR